MAAETEKNATLLGSLGTMELVHKVELPTAQLVGVGVGLFIIIISGVSLSYALKAKKSGG